MSASWEELNEQIVNCEPPMLEYPVIVFCCLCLLVGLFHACEKWSCFLLKIVQKARGGGRARSLYATPPSPPPPPPRVLKDSGAGSATNKCL